MRITELQNDFDKLFVNRDKLFVDLDGVLSDFNGGIKKLTGKYPDEIEKKTLWKTVIQAAKDGKKIWYDLNKLPDADQLWNYIKGYNPTILTAGATSIKSSFQEKRDWVKENLGPGIPVTVTDSGILKAEYAKPNYILIDDQQKVITAWTEAGGIGILHTSANSTIEKLKELGL